jgi:hypothetical protein
MCTTVEELCFLISLQQNNIKKASELTEKFLLSEPEAQPCVYDDKASKEASRSDLKDCGTITSIVNCVVICNCGLLPNK